MKTIAEFEDALKESLETVFGNCEKYKGVLRSLPQHLGVSNTGAIFEASMEMGPNPDVPYPVVHFHVTLAQKVEDEKVPGILSCLNDLNTVISAGAFPCFGCFGYYAPLRQIYMSYRMPVNKDALDEDFANVRYYLGEVSYLLDLFADYILFICDDPESVTMEAYMNYLDSVANLNDLDARLDKLDKTLEELMKNNTTD